MCTYISSVSSYFALLNVVERPLEPYAPRRVLVILEEEFEGTGGDPDFRMFHRKSGFRACAEAFWKNLDVKIESVDGQEGMGRN